MSTEELLAIREKNSNKLLDEIEELESRLAVDDEVNTYKKAPSYFNRRRFVSSNSFNTGQVDIPDEETAEELLQRGVIREI